MADPSAPAGGGSSWLWSGSAAALEAAKQELAQVKEDLTKTTTKLQTTRQELKATKGELARVKDALAGEEVAHASTKSDLEQSRIDADEMRDRFQLEMAKVLNQAAGGGSSVNPTNANAQAEAHQREIEDLKERFRKQMLDAEDVRVQASVAAEKEISGLKKQVGDLQGELQKMKTAKSQQSADMRAAEASEALVKQLEQSVAAAHARENSAHAQLEEMRSMLDRLSARPGSASAQTTAPPSDDDVRDRVLVRSLVKFQNLSVPTMHEIKVMIQDLRTAIGNRLTEYNKNVGAKLTKTLDAIEVADGGVPVPPRDDLDNIQLTPEQFGTRYANMDQTQINQFNEDIDRMRGVARAFALPPNERNIELGNIIVSMQRLTKGLRLSEKASPEVIVCGYQSAGKTLLLGALLSAHVGYSAIGKATRCPVHYMFAHNADAREARCWVTKDGGNLARDKSLAPIGLKEVAQQVKLHMEEIGRKATPDTKYGFSKNPLYVQIESAEVEAPGLIIDMPGVQQDSRTGTADAKEEAAYNEQVYATVREKLLKLDPDYAFAICVEEAQKRREEIYFHTKALEGVPTDRYEVVFTKADFHYTTIDGSDPQRPWLSTFSKANIDKYSMIGAIYADMRLDPTKEFYPIVCLKGVERLNNDYAAGIVPSVAEYKRELQHLLKHNYEGMVSAYNEMCRDAAFVFNGQNMFKPEETFDFFRTRERLMNRRNRGLTGACKEIEGYIRQVKKMAEAHADALNMRGVDSSPEIENVLNLGFAQFWDRWQSQSHGNMYAGIPDHDHDYDGKLAVHDKFPLNLKYKLRDVPSVSVDGTLEQLLNTHGLGLCSYHGSAQEDILGDINKVLAENVDGQAHTCLNIESAYQRCIQRFLLRMASVSMQVVDIRRMIYASGKGGVNYQYNLDHEKGANVVVSMCLGLFYDQALQYLRDVLREFFYGAVDTVLTDTWLVDQQSNELFKQDRAFALFRSQLRRATEVFVDEEIDALRNAIVSFVSFKEAKRVMAAAASESSVASLANTARGSMPDPTQDHESHLADTIKNTIDLFSKNLPMNDVAHRSPHSTVDGGMQDKNYAQRLVRKIFCTTHRQALLSMATVLEDNFGRLTFRAEGNRGLSNIMQRFMRTLVLRLDYKSVDGELLNHKESTPTSSAFLTLPMNAPLLKERLSKYYAVTSRAEFYAKTAKSLSEMATGLNV